MRDVPKAKRRTERRLAAEWTTLIVSVAIVVGLIALVALQFRTDGEVRIDVAPRIEDVREAGGLHYLPLEIANRGGPTALDVIVRVTSGDETVEIAIDILAGGGSDEVIAVFRVRPTQVDARVVSFRVP